MSGSPGPWVPPPAAPSSARADSALWAVGRSFGILLEPRAWLPPAILGAIVLLPTAVAPVTPPPATVAPGVAIDQELRRVTEALLPTFGATFILGVILYPIQAALQYRAAANYLAGRPQTPLAPGLDRTALRYLVQFAVMYAITFGVVAPLVLSALTGELGLLLLLAIVSLTVLVAVAVRLAPAPVFIVTHDQGAVEALATAWRLTSGNAWRVLRWLVVSGVVLAILSWVIEAITTTALRGVLGPSASGYVAVVLSAPFEVVGVTVLVLLARVLLQDARSSLGPIPVVEAT